MPRSPYDLDTIGQLIRFQHRVALHCENYRGGLSCGFVKWLDLEKLAERLGMDHGVLHDDLAPHLWCTKCGGKRVSIRLHPPGAPWVNSDYDRPAPPSAAKSLEQGECPSPDD